MSLTVKAFLGPLEKDRGEPEIRRFTVNRDVASSFDHLKNKITEVFPSLGNDSFKIFWKDSDGDHIAFSTDSELADALGVVSDGIFRVYIRSDSEASEEGKKAFHPGVVCDGCQGPIYGCRFRCVVCPDYDLCAVCNEQGKHVDHAMMLMRTPEQRQQFDMGFQYNRPPGPPFGPPPHHFGPPPSHHGPPHHGPPGGPPGWGQFMWRKMWKRMMRQYWRDNWEKEGEGPPMGGGRGGPRMTGPAFERQRSVDRESNASTSTKPERKDGEASSGDEGSPAEDYLKNIGESVSSMLDPLGVEVEVDYEHKGRRHCRRGRQGGPPFMRGWKHWGGGGGGKHGGRGGWRHGGGGWQRGGGCRGGWAPWAPWSGPWEDEAEGSAKKSAEGMETEVVEAGKKEDAAMTEGAEEEWMIVAPAKDQQDGAAEEAKFNDTLKQLAAMGFKDNGGKLTKLVQEKKGNLSEVLDVIQASSKSK